MPQDRPAHELPVMKAHCATCPFKPMRSGQYQNNQLASKVIDRTLFKGHQICHGTEGPNREAHNRCKGSFDYNLKVYNALGCGEFIK